MNNKFKMVRHRFFDLCQLLTRRRPFAICAGLPLAFQLTILLGEEAYFFCLSSVRLERVNKPLAISWYGKMPREKQRVHVKKWKTS
jgi:hypothetical protein